MALVGADQAFQSLSGGDDGEQNRLPVWRHGGKHAGVHEFFLCMQRVVVDDERIEDFSLRAFLWLIGSLLLALEWTTNWRAGDPPKMEVRTLTTSNGKEVEVIWREGNLQIADAVSGEWRDHLGSSPLRFPLAAAKDKQFFRIKPEEEEEQEENQATPPQPEK